MIDPRNIGGLKGWARGGGNLWTLNGSTVSAVTDVAPSVGAFNQVTASKQPTALSSWRNGLSAFDIDAALKKMFGVAWTTLQPNAGYTRFAVFSMDTFVASTTIYLLPGLVADNDTGNCGTAFDNNGGGRVLSWQYDIAGAPQSVNFTIAASTPYVLTVWSDPADRLYAKLNHGADTGSVAYGGGGTQAGGGISKFGSNYAGTACMDGQIGELIYYNRILTASERGLVQNYLHSRWAI